MSVRKCLLQLLRDCVRNENTVSQVPSEWLEELYRLANRYQLAHVVGEQLYRHQLLPSDSPWKEKFELAQQVSMVQDIRMASEASRVFVLCEKEGIDYIPLKGTVLKTIYPKPHMRTGSDIDFLVRREDIERVAELLRKARYKVGEYSSHEISVITPSGVLLEVHFCLFEYDEQISTVLENVWETAELVAGTKHKYMLSNEMFYYYHIAHLLKHFMFGGCGIKSLLDLYLMNEKWPLEGNAFDEMLENTGIKTFYEACVKLSQIWFGDEEHDDTTRAMERFIFDAGAYGTHENYINVTQSQTSGHFEASLGRLFLKREVLQNQYPNLKKHPSLLWFYQVKRWADIGLSEGWARFRDWQKTNSNAKQEKVDTTREMLRNLDLLEKKL